MRVKSFIKIRIFVVLMILPLALVLISNNTCQAQVSPGPYEILPFEEGFIVEAWFDLQSGTQIADWTGWIGSSWTSPHAYNSHTGTDFSVETGTPVYAAAPGKVTQVVTNIPENTGTGYGNYVWIQVNGKSPNNEDLDIVTAHMLPSIVVTVGQNVVTGQLLGYSDNTGNSTSEHVHTESNIRNGSSACPFYNAHFKYPVMFTKNMRTQTGHLIKIKAATTAIRADRYDTSSVITYAYKDQMYFSAYWQCGYYRVLIPNNTSNRGGWIKALDADEVFFGATIIQALPDSGTYVHTGTLASPYSIKASPDDSAAQIGQIVYGGGRFAADSVQNGWYRIAVPGSSAQWGWVKANSRMVVFPNLYNPSLNLNDRPKSDFPLSDDFSITGKSYFGRAKFNRSTVASFSPASPGGDGKALFMTDSTNAGDGLCESILLGKVNHRNYYVQADMYFDYKSELASSGYERYGVFVRDDGFAGMDQTFEGKGNCYAFTFDSDDGRIRAAKIVESTVTDFLPSKQYITQDGWHTIRIEAEDNHIRYYMDGNLLYDATDTTFSSGPCGLGYSNKFSGYPTGRGAYFDNFKAESLEKAASPNIICTY